MRSSGKLAKMEHPHPWRTPNVWAFSLSSLFSDWGHEMVTAMLPGFLTSIGAPVLALGLTEGISNLSQSLAAVWGGKVNDGHAGRHRVLTIGYVLTGMKALMALASWWPWVVVLRTIGWWGRGARGPIRDAYIAEEVAPSDVGKAYGLREAFDTSGAILGPLAAAVLVSFFTPRTIIALSAIPAALTVIMILRVRKLPHRHPATFTDHEVKGIRWTKPYLRYRMATGVFTLGYLAPTFFILRVWQSGVTVGPFSTHTIALLLYALHNVVYAAGSYPVGHFSDGGSGRTLLLLGYGVWAVAVGGFAFAHADIWVWVLLFSLTGLATSIIEVGQKMVTVKVVPESTRGQGLGQIAAVRGGGQLVSSVMVGVLWTMNQVPMAFGLEGMMAAIGLVMTFWAIVPE